MSRVLTTCATGVGQWSWLGSLGEMIYLRDGSLTLG